MVITNIKHTRNTVVCRYCLSSWVLIIVSHIKNMLSSGQADTDHSFSLAYSLVLCAGM